MTKPKPKKKVYLAAPFFNPEHLELVKVLERTILTTGLDLYSPRQDGVLKDMSPEERRASTKRIFDLNCAQMGRANLILALLNWRDTGTIWELGYCFARKKFYDPALQIVSFTSASHEVNVMIREGVDLHVHGFPALEVALREFAEDKPFTTEQDVRETF